MISFSLSQNRICLRQFLQDCTLFLDVSFLFSRRGLPIPGRMDVTLPQQALVISSTHLPLPVNQILTLIRERFSPQLERYNIDLDDGYAQDHDL